MRADILVRLGQTEEASAALVGTENLAVRQLTELQRTLLRFRLSEEQWNELAKRREVQELELALRGIAPVTIRQRFKLQKECIGDDRHGLALRLEQGRISITPSFAGPVGGIAVEKTDEKLVFTLGAKPCQVHVIFAKGVLTADTPPVTGNAGGRFPHAPVGQQPIEYSVHPPSVVGCASGSATIRA